MSPIELIITPPHPKGERGPGKMEVLVFRGGHMIQKVK